MRSRHPLEKTVAFLCGLLAVGWIGGACGATFYKAVYWFVCDAWPDTGLYGLLPGAAVRAVLAMPKDEPLRPILLQLFGIDLLTYIILVPPLVLLPCLAWLLAGHGPTETWRLAARPFSPLGAADRARHADTACLRRGRGLPGPG
ncbi:MAG: hypothetical protein ACP59X_17505 [Solidesulfovibrio sp. DCME]|uniref:hypothetical protein n=1 Tax=Solidesulfovibrio sp. DCME TaxID=3447380 RepID=UPI003D150869